MNEQPFQQMLAAFSSPEIQGCWAAIESAAGYKLSARDRQPFLYFHGYITEPQPDFITRWRADPSLEKWYHRLVNGFLGDLQNTFTCVLYHHDRLVEIETRVMDAVERFNYRGLLKNSTVAGGNTLVWDFEYQAFVLAYRRCLDYFARAASAYFKNEVHSFRKLEAYLVKTPPKEVGEALAPILGKYEPDFAFVLSEGTRKSLRDRITHYGYVHAGTVNLSERGFVFAGGEELVAIGTGSLLSDVLARRMSALRGFLHEAIFSFVDAVRAAERGHV
jgi:hypothetical protein